MTSPKVFGIGMHKTGTSSLATALYSLGYSVRGFDVGIDVDELGNLDPATGRERVWNACLDVVAEADAFQDTPWWLFYRELDEAFPGSKFISTVRDREGWLRSVQTHFGRRSNGWDLWMFDGATSVSDPDLYRERFDSHYAGVAEWFADRPDALLTMTFDGSASWVELCEHLGHPTPTYPFPRSNPLSERSASFLRRVRRRLMRMWQERFGSGGPETRCGQLYDRCHAVTGAIDTALPADATAFSAFLDAATGRVVSLKAALGIPYEPAGSGIDGDTPSARWARFRFELRHTIGQVSYSTIDVGFDGGTIGDACSRLLDDVSAWAITPPIAD